MQAGVNGTFSNYADGSHSAELRYIAMRSLTHFIEIGLNRRGG
jgi:hypothetical protein